MLCVAYDSRIHSFLVLTLILPGEGGAECIPAGQFIAELSEQDKQTCIHSNRKLEELVCPKIHVFGVWKEGTVNTKARFRLKDVNSG